MSVVLSKPAAPAEDAFVNAPIEGMWDSERESPWLHVVLYAATLVGSLLASHWMAR